MILSIVMIIVTTLDPFFLLSIGSKICQFCLSLVGYVGAVNQSFEVCIKSLAKVTHSVECLSVQSIVAFLLSSSALRKKSDLHPNAPLKWMLRLCRRQNSLPQH